MQNQSICFPCLQSFLPPYLGHNIINNIIRINAMKYPDIVLPPYHESNSNKLHNAIPIAIPMPMLIIKSLAIILPPLYFFII